MAEAETIQKENLELKRSIETMQTFISSHMKVCEGGVCELDVSTARID